MSSELERRIAKLEQQTASVTYPPPTAVYVEVLEGLTGLRRDEILARAPDTARLFRAILNALTRSSPWDDEDGDDGERK